MATQSTSLPNQEVETQIDPKYKQLMAKFDELDTETFKSLTQFACEAFNISISADIIHGAFMPGMASLEFLPLLPDKSLVHIFTDKALSLSDLTLKFTQGIFTPEKEIHVVFAVGHFTLVQNTTIPVTTTPVKYILLTFGDKKITPVINLYLNYTDVVLLDFPPETLIGTTLAEISACKMPVLNL